MDSKKVLAELHDSTGFDAGTIPAEPRPLLFTLSCDRPVDTGEHERIQDIWRQLWGDEPPPAPLAVLTPGTRLGVTIHPDARPFCTPEEIERIRAEFERYQTGPENVGRLFTAPSEIRVRPSEEMIHQMIAAGVVTTDEVRGFYGLPPKADGSGGEVCRMSGPEEWERLQMTAAFDPGCISAADAALIAGGAALKTEAEICGTKYGSVEETVVMNGDPAAPRPGRVLRAATGLRLVTATDERERCCVIIDEPNSLFDDGARCPKASRYWVGTSPLDDYTYCCAEHLQSVRRPGDAVQEVQ